jgi:hypothetical protein
MGKMYGLLRKVGILGMCGHAGLEYLGRMCYPASYKKVVILGWMCGLAYNMVGITGKNVPPKKVGVLGKDVQPCMQKGGNTWEVCAAMCTKRLWRMRCLAYKKGENDVQPCIQKGRNTWGGCTALHTKRWE